MAAEPWRARVAAALPRADTCPPLLRAVLDRWRRGEAPTAELREASYEQGLRELDESRWQPPPPVPTEVAAFWALPPETTEKGQQAKRALWERLQEQHAGYFTAARDRDLANLRHRAWLDELLAWALDTNRPEAVIACKHALGSHTVREAP